MVTADEAKAKLLEGNARFVSGTSQCPRRNTKHRMEIVEGQHPLAVVTRSESK